MAQTAIAGISLHENCRWDGPEYFHVRVQLDYSKALEIADVIAKAFERLNTSPFGFAFKHNGLDIEVVDGEAEQGSGWQSLLIDGAYVSLYWDRSRSWIDMSMFKRYDTVEDWMEACTTDVERKLA